MWPVILINLISEYQAWLINVNEYYEPMWYCDIIVNEYYCIDIIKKSNGKKKKKKKKKEEKSKYINWSFYSDALLFVILRDWHLFDTLHLFCSFYSWCYILLHTIHSYIDSILTYIPTLMFYRCSDVVLFITLLLFVVIVVVVHSCTYTFIVIPIVCWWSFYVTVVLHFVLTSYS